MINFYKLYIDCVFINISGNILIVVGKFSFIIFVCGGVINIWEFILGEGFFFNGNLLDLVFDC